MTAKRVVICTASVGHGHTGAAMAIAAAIRQMEPDAAVEVAARNFLANMATRTAAAFLAMSAREAE